MVDIRYLVGTPAGSGPLLTRCPFHHDTGRPNMAVYPDGTWCFVCGKGESAEEFMRRLGATATDLPLYTPGQPASGAVRTGTGTPSVGGGEDSLAVLAETFHRVLVEGQSRGRLDYFTGRGIFYQTIERHQLGHTGYAFSIPVFDYRDPTRIIGIKYRMDPVYEQYLENPETGKPHPRYWNTRGMGTPVFQAGPRDGPLWVCEGELDAILLGQYGVTAYTTTGGSGSIAKVLGPVLRRFRRPIYIATDCDDAGEDAARTLRAALRPDQSVTRIEFTDGKDVTDALGSVPSGRRAALINLLQVAGRPMDEDG